MGFHIIWISLRYTGFWNHYVFLMNWFAFSTEESVSPACSPGLVCLLSRVQLFHDPMNCNPPGSSIYGIDIYGIDIYGKSMGFPREEYWSGSAGRVPGISFPEVLLPCVPSWAQARLRDPLQIFRAPSVSVVFSSLLLGFLSCAISAPSPFQTLISGFSTLWNCWVRMMLAAAEQRKSEVPNTKEAK